MRIPAEDLIELKQALLNIEAARLRAQELQGKLLVRYNIPAGWTVDLNTGEVLAPSEAPKGPTDNKPSRQQVSSAMEAVE